MAERFGSLHFVPQSEALEAELMQREMEEAAASSSASNASAQQAKEGEAKEEAHSSVRDNMDTTNGNCLPSKMAQTKAKAEATDAVEDTGKKEKCSAAKEGAENGAAAAGVHLKKQHKMCEKVQETTKVAAMNEPSASEKKKKKKSEEKDQPSQKSAAESSPEAGSVSAAGSDKESAVSSASGGTSFATADRQATKKKDDDGNTTTTTSTAATAKSMAAADHADEKKVRSPEKHDGHHGHHGKKHGNNHHHGHGHGKKHPQAHSHSPTDDGNSKSNVGDESEKKKGIADTSTAKDDDAAPASSTSTNTEEAAGANISTTSNAQQQNRPQDDHRSTSMKEEVVKEEVDVRNWFANTLSTGRQRSCAAAITDPALVELILELVLAREKKEVNEVKTKTGAGSEGSAPQYAPEELARLYDEYHRAAVVAAAAHASSSGGGGGKKKGNKNKKAAAAVAAAAAAAATDVATKDKEGKDEAGPGSASAKTKTKGNVDATESETPTGTTGSTSATATATAAATVTATTADDAYRIRAEGRDGAKDKNKDKVDNDDEEEPKMIIQYKSGLVVPVTRTSKAAGTKAGAAAATTRAVLAAAERTKNSPSSPSTAEAGAVPAPASPSTKTAEDNDDGDIGSKPSFSALGGAKVNADVEEAAAALELASSGTDASAAELSKKAKKKAKKARQQANKIVRAKQAAAQAMGRQAQASSGGAAGPSMAVTASSSATASQDQMELLRHARIVLPSTLGFASPGKNPPSGGQEWGKPFGPVLILEPDFVDGDSNALLDLADKIVDQIIPGASFLSHSDWTRKVSEAGGAISASILLLAQMEVSIRAVCATATGTSLGSHKDADKEQPGSLRSILSTSSSGAAVAAGTDAALRNALDLWVRVRANENDEGVMLLSSKIHSDMHQYLSESYPFHLEDIIAAPLHLPSFSRAHSESTEWPRWWNSTIIPPLRCIKKEMQSIPVLSGSDQSSGRASSKNNGTGVENSGQQSTSSKSKKKKKKKSKKKKAAEAAAAEPGDGVGPNVAENAIRASGATGNAPPSTPSVEAPSINPSFSTSTDQSSVDAVGLSNQEAVQSQANTTAVPPTRGSITIGAGNNTVVGLGRMMEEEEHHDDEWETVPTKGAEKRNNNNNSKKNGGAPDNKGSGGGRQQQNHQQQSPSSGKKKKNKSKGQRKRGQALRLVDDIISGILDNVEHEVDRRRRAEGRRRANEERKRAVEAQHAPAGAQSKSASLRDVVVGASGNLQPSVERTSSMPNVVDGEDRGKKQKSRGPKKTGAAGSPATGRNPVSGVMPAAGGGGDKASVGQKTAPTLPDTVSGRSTSGGTRGRTAAVDKARAPSATVSGVESSVSMDETETATPGKTAATSTGAAQPPQDTSPQPPLPICNTVSASSSVASSLEAPHATRHRPRGRSYELKEDDVGYHLVKLCDKLSDEMAVFMERRAMALNIRRTERNALLGALQDAASKVFSGHARVETYGSCATQLDLPSSDLDVVICGLNDIDPNSTQQQGPPSAQDAKGQQQQKGKGKKSKNKGGSGNNSGSSAGGASSESDPKQEGPDEESSLACTSQPQSQPQPEPQPQPPQQPPHYQQYPPQYYQYYPPPSPSGLKVLRLAAELEMHPWAVQVKAIPTATVPVIKLLADPTRVPGGAVWMMQHQHMPPVPMPPPHPQHQQQQQQPQSQEDGPVAVEEQGHAQPQGQQPQQPFYNGPAGAAPMPFIHPGAMPWRGADIMNGLISIDITFEGPEHGGIGSTIFSQAFVHEVCTESNLPPEATAAVQMIMVIKELLAQRRLNEPYSGGLSSFAVLLLAVSVIRERKLIQDEMRRMEKQRRAVEAAVEGPSTAPKQSKSKKKASKQQNKNEADDIRSLSQREKKSSKKDTDCSESVTSTATPIAKASRAVKQESKQTQTDQGEATTLGQVTSQNSSEQSKQSKSTKQQGSTKVNNDVPTSEKAAASKGGFSFKDALKGNAKPKAPPTKKDEGREAAKQAESTPKAPSGPKSWASIAKTKSQAPAQPQAPVSAESNKKESEQPKKSKEGSQVLRATTEDPPAKTDNDTGKYPAPEPDTKQKDKSTGKKNDESEAKQTEPAKKKVSESTPIMSASVAPDSVADEYAKPQAPTASAAASAVTASASESVPARSGGGGTEESRRQLPFPQGSNDVLEVLCTGEPTAGKLLMHFLLFYGQHFESQATAVDVSGVHHPDFHRYRNRPYGSYRLSSFVPRHAGGSIDPVTGMYTVDPIVIYDPLEGCENNNVARSCFAWASIRSVFHQCYMTLSGACERGSGTNEASVGIGGSGRGVPRSNRPSRSSSAESGKVTDDARQQQNHHGQHHEDSQQQVESVLALLLSF